MLGFSVEQWLDDPTFWHDHIHPNDRQGVLDPCARATAEQRSLEFEYRMITAEGHVMWLGDFLNIVVEAGQATERVGVMIDITERREAEDAPAKANKASGSCLPTTRCRCGSMIGRPMRFSMSTMPRWINRATRAKNFFR